MFYGGKGPNVGLFSCDNDWNQQWVQSNDGSGIEEADDGRCMSTASTGKPGLVWVGGSGSGTANAWTTF
jgi:hypothetical protein